MGWGLSAVQKWYAYGHAIPDLAVPAVQLGLPVSIVANSEAEQVMSAAWKAGLNKPVIWRIVPSAGPAKYGEVADAARKGIGIVVGPA